MRDKQAINSMVAEIAGENAAKGSITATARVQKSIIKACLDGARTPKVKNWTPRYMQVRQESYRVETPLSAETTSQAKGDSRKVA